MRVSLNINGIDWEGLCNRPDSESAYELASVTCDGRPFRLETLPRPVADHIEAALVEAAEEAEEDAGPDEREPDDDDLSDFYGGGGARPMSEQYREAAEAKKRWG